MASSSDLTRFYKETSARIFVNGKVWGAVKLALNARVPLTFGQTQELNKEIVKVLEKRFTELARKQDVRDEEDSTESSPEG